MALFFRLRERFGTRWVFRLFAHDFRNSFEFNREKRIAEFRTIRYFGLRDDA